MKDKKKGLDISGVRYGRLVAIEKVGKNKSGNAIWNCKCDCGNIVNVCISNLRNSHTKSCGCYAKDLSHNRKPRLTHGMSRTRIYHIWQGIKQRCYDERSTSFEHYGAKGITMCKEWETFEVFCEWAYNNGYNDKLTIDRKDVLGNYEPDNCRWVDVKTQNRNKETTCYITLNGETKSLGEWHELLGIPISTMVNRRNKGLPAELILQTEKFSTRPNY